MVAGSIYALASRHGLSSFPGNPDSRHGCRFHFMRDAAARLPDSRSRHGLPGHPHAWRHGGPRAVRSARAVRRAARQGPRSPANAGGGARGNRLSDCAERRLPQGNQRGRSARAMHSVLSCRPEGGGAKRSRLPACFPLLDAWSDDHSGRKMDGEGASGRAAQPKKGRGTRPGASHASAGSAAPLDS